MANDIRGNPMYVDTEGIVSTKPLVITKIILKPDATGDAATFSYWWDSDAVASNKAAANTTVSSTTITSDGNFPTANINPDQILKIYTTSSENNVGIWQISTNADNNTVVVDNPATVFGQDTTLANESAKLYSWNVWDPHPFMVIRGSGVDNDTSPVEVDFDPPAIVPNLTMSGLSANAVLYIHLA